MKLDYFLVGLMALCVALIAWAWIFPHKAGGAPKSAQTAVSLWTVQTERTVIRHVEITESSLNEHWLKGRLPDGTHIDVCGNMIVTSETQ